MNQEDIKPIAFDRSAQLDIQALISATKAIQPVKAPAEEIFSKLYLNAKDALERGVTRKELLAMWAENKFKLHPAKFKALYNAEARKRGDVIERGEND